MWAAEVERAVAQTAVPLALHEDGLANWPTAELRLERARAFAMHALDQFDDVAGPRHSLWTGTIGVALYLCDCVEEWQGMPVLDRL